MNRIKSVIIDKYTSVWVIILFGLRRKNNLKSKELNDIFGFRVIEIKIFLYEWLT